MIIQITAAIVATLGFGILFGLNRKKLFYAGMSGGIGWFFYLISLKVNLSEAIAFLAASLSMTIFPIWVFIEEPFI